jgi:hypothetical protein
MAKLRGQASEKAETLACIFNLATQSFLLVCISYDFLGCTAREMIGARRGGRSVIATLRLLDNLKPALDSLLDPKTQKALHRLPKFEYLDNRVCYFTH